MFIMNELRKELLVNSINLYDFLGVYGVDRFNTKEDISIISLIEEILAQNCYYNLLSECDFKVIDKVLNTIKHRNPMFKYCRLDISDYKNLGNKQNIRTYQIIE